MDVRRLTKWLAPLALGTVLVLPPPGHDSMTLGPNGTTFTYRSQNGDSIILRPGGQQPIFDYDNGGGNHTTLIPGQPPVFTFGDGDDDAGDGD
jgi:hypothetical protein